MSAASISFCSKYFISSYWNLNWRKIYHDGWQWVLLIFLETWRRTIEINEFEFKGWNDETTITKLYWLLACWFIHLNEEIKNKRAFVWFLFNWKEYFTSQVQSFMYRIYPEQNLVYAGRRINLNVQNNLFIYSLEFSPWLPILIAC